MNAADLSTLEAGAAISRDIFMVGVYTAQRISDYKNIRREDIHTTTKRWIEDVPDEENPGHTTPRDAQALHQGRPTGRRPEAY